MDTSFDGDGKVVTSFGTDNVAVDLAVQTDGKIVAAVSDGVDQRNLGASGFSVVRYNPDGSLDSGFGSGGRVVTSFGDIGQQVASLALQADGRIVTAGGDFVVTRLEADGDFDPTFGPNGTSPFDPTPDPNLRRNSTTNAVVIQDNGRIVAVGYGAVPGSADNDIVLVGYLP